MNLIAIRTRRYSKVVSAFLSQHSSAVVRLEKRVTNADPSAWCTNKNLKSLRDFSLSVGDQVILSFHDHPEHLIASGDQIELVQRLADEKLLRFDVAEQTTGETWISKLFGWLRRT